MVKSNALFYGDNLVWLRDKKYFPDESVDLIYLVRIPEQIGRCSGANRPPFRSKPATLGVR